MSHAPRLDPRRPVARPVSVATSRPASANGAAREADSLRAAVVPDAPQVAKGTLRAPHVDLPSRGVLPQLQVRSTTPAPLLAAPAAQLRAPTPRPELSNIARAFDTLPMRAVEGRVRLFSKNTDAWVARWNLVKEAKTEIDAQYFIWNRDIFGTAMLGALYRKQKAGVPVRLMLDASGDTFGRLGFTQKGRGQDMLQELVAAGAEVRVYHPLYKKLPKQLLHPETAIGVSCNHDKILRTESGAMTGGRNISRDYFADPADAPDVFRDSDLLAMGAGASAELKKAFDAEFQRDDLLYTVEADELGNFDRREVELVSASLMMDAWLARPALSEAEKQRLRSDASVRKATAEALLAQVIEQLPSEGVHDTPGFFEARFLRKLANELVGYTELAGAGRTYDPNANLRPAAPVKVLDRTSLGNGKIDQIGGSLVHLADAAEKHILLANPYVVLTEEALAVLERAGNRGVKIDILTNSPDSSDSALTQAFFLEQWPQILARVPNARIFVFTGEQKLHEKIEVADGEVAAVGSYNLDYLSAKVNGEVVMATKSKAIARDLLDAFRADVASPSNRVREYTIERNADGTPKRVDGEPVIAHGPRDHMSTGKWWLYQALRLLTRGLEQFPQLETLRRAFHRG